MSNVIIQAQEQKGLKNQDYPNGYYPFFNGNTGNRSSLTADNLYSVDLSKKGEKNGSKCC